MNHKVLKFTVFCILTFISTIVILNYIFSKKFTFNLKEDSINVAFGNEYEQSGYEVKLFNKKLDNYVVINDNLNLDKVGEYQVVYLLDYGLLKREQVQTVKVVDNVKPILILNGDDEVTIYKGIEYHDEGASAADNYDGDITDKIETESNLDTSKLGEYYIKYFVSDSSENYSEIYRKINVVNDINIARADDNAIINYIKENKYNVSIGYYNLSTDKSFYYNAGSVYYGCSLIKTLDAMYLYQNNLVTNKLSYYIKKAISVSDNPSHHYLINHIGKKKLRSYGLSLGATYTLVGGDNFGNTNVYDQVVYLKKLYELTNKYSDLKSYFINDFENYLNFDNVKFMHKYGLLSPNYHDVGIYLGDNPYIVVILTKHSNNRKIVTELSKLIYQYHMTN